MTAYNLKPPEILPSLAWQEAKAKRKHVLEAVRKRRRERYNQFLQKLKNQRLHPNNDLL